MLLSFVVKKTVIWGLH